ncbi:hypothetical protein BCR36DRAFT_414302 [Piromyces finnis]|uniref:Uncharacterized protein n=1 Tax=Piromyces finnis TaxID=1754191 RepID=A0A1Y1V2T0_9FUNG|nr:hypothetical protein BCR36DRAFT_414302 [Piromyces finnis]|eukprot:ORX45997.1 hypothetical protein BCR36DRAFT_414302 [Piromyces finnis]
MEQKKIDSLLRQIQSKLSYLKKLETVSPSSFINYKTPITSPIHNDVSFSNFPIKKNIKSLENCFSNIIMQLWWKYYKISYRISMINSSNFYERRNHNLKDSSIPQFNCHGRNHILSLRELAAFKLADSISNQIEKSSQMRLEEENDDFNNNDKNQDIFSLIPYYIPYYLNNLIFFEHIVNICISKINIPKVLKSLIEICIEYRAYHQGYKLLQKHFILKPYKELKNYKWAFSVAKRVFRKHEFLRFIIDKLKIQHVYNPSFIDVLSFIKIRNKNIEFYFIEKAIKVMIDFIHQYANKNQSNIVFSNNPVLFFKNKYHNQNDLISYLSSNYTANINLESEKNINYFYSLYYYYIKRYVELSTSKEYHAVSSPLDILPEKMNSNILNKHKYLSSALIILHLFNYNKKHYKYQHPEIYFPLLSKKYKKELNLYDNYQWKKCAQYCQKLDFIFLDEQFRFSNNIRKFQNLIQIMERVKLYQEAFAYVNWMYDTLNIKSSSNYSSDGFKYSRRRRRIVNYNEYYSDEESNDEKQLPSTPKHKLIQPPQYTSPVTPNKIKKKYLPTLYQEAETLANIINEYSADTIWQYETSIESWVKKRKSESKKININNNCNNNKYNNNNKHNNKSNTIIINENGYEEESIINSNNAVDDVITVYSKRKLIKKVNSTKKVKLIKYQKEPTISPSDDYFKITEALPFNDEVDDFLL